MTTITDATRWTAVPNDDHALFAIDIFADGPGRCPVAGVLGVQDRGEPCDATWAHAQLIAAAPVLLCLLRQARAALPDAWFAVKCGVPRELVEAINAAIRTATAPAPKPPSSPVPTPPAAC